MSFFTIITNWGKCETCKTLWHASNDDWPSREGERVLLLWSLLWRFFKGIFSGSRPLAIIIMDGMRSILFWLLFNYLCAVFLFFVSGGVHEMENIFMRVSDSLAIWREKEQGRGWPRERVRVSVVIKMSSSTFIYLLFLFCLQHQFFCPHFFSVFRSFFFFVVCFFFVFVRIRFACQSTKTKYNKIQSQSNSNRVESNRIYYIMKSTSTTATPAATLTAMSTLRSRVVCV